MPTIEEAYERMRNPSKLELPERLQCHMVMLRAGQPINKDQLIANAIADLCEVGFTLILRRK